RQVLASIKAPIELVSLYTRPKPVAAGTAQPIDRAQYVSDLLDEYRRAGNQVSVESIDPQTEPGRVDELALDLEKRYGKNLADYREFLDHYLAPGGDYEKLTSSLQNESGLADKLPLDNLSNDIVAVIRTPGNLLQNLTMAKNYLQAEQRAKYPDYAGATSNISSQMDDISQFTADMAKTFADPANLKGLPAQVASYMKQSVPRLKAIGALAGAVNKKLNSLGELKIKELTDALSAPNAILVLGPESMGWRILSEQQVWPNTAGESNPSGAAKARPVFAGEQVITTAIYSLSQKKKPLVVFVRTDGEPLTLPIRATERGEMMPAGPFFLMRRKLEQYNFDVLEKDASGMYPMMAQMNGEEAEPEATDAQLKQAIWLVIDEQPQSRAPSHLADMLQKHLEDGGSALVLAGPTLFPDQPPVDDLSKATAPFGIKIRNDIIAVHEKIPAGEGAQHDIINEFEQEPDNFVLSDYGSASFVKPLQDLKSLVQLLVTVEIHHAPGATVTPILPVPTAPQWVKSWGTSNVQPLLHGQAPVYNPADGDVPGPLIGGAASERAGGARLVAIGSVLMPNAMLSNDFLPIDDPDFDIRDMPDPLFPGNGQLALNSIFWLAHEDSMISISPEIAQQPRIGNMTPRTLAAWRFFLLVVMPLGAAGAGIGMYIVRRS
ncbi:MAG TPA: hypothetical protein VHY37_07515, partial [Tepidisphaeraceae bacterium]|nr:hypothetical protein [Tepidisphaeraceae bacterium]